MVKCQSCVSEEAAGMACLSCPCSKIGKSAEVNNNVYVNYFLHQEQQIKDKQMTEARRSQMKAKLLKQEVDVLKQKLGTGKHKTGDRRTVMTSNAAEVSKKVEERLARMEARLQVEKDNRELRKKANLVRAKLQRFYFLMRLLPLSRSPDDYAAFARKYKEERVNANWREQRKVEKGVGQESGSANIEIVPSPPSQATEAGVSGLKVIKEEMLQMGFYQALVQLSDEGLRKFCSWKGRWSNSKDFVEKKSGASLELKPTGKGELLIVGHTIAVKRARNMIQTALSMPSHMASGVTGPSAAVKVLEDLHKIKGAKCEGRFQTTIQLSLKSWQMFANWKGGWSDGRDFVEAETGATLEVKAPGNFLVSGPEASVQRAHNMVVRAANPLNPFKATI